MTAMPAIYKSDGPDRDTQFILHELLKIEQYAGVVRGYENVSGEGNMAQMLIGTANELAQEVLEKIHNAHIEKSKEINHQVILPKAMKELYVKYFEAGLAAVTAEEEHGGAALPELLNTIISERFNSVDISWTMLPILIQGAYAALRDHGSDALKEMFSEGLTNGTIGAAMDMTEPGVGTNIADTKAKAVPKEGKEGEYELSGDKIFITFGDHDATPNILHLILARLPGAPEGITGLTLFAVPKLIDGNPNKPEDGRGVYLDRIETEKLGLENSPTCCMNYDRATAYIVGSPNQGVTAMFTMMNEARLHVAVQAIGGIETAYQSALKYTTDPSVRAPMGVYDNKAGVKTGEELLFEKDDVRRKLLSMRSMVQGGRALVSYLSLQMDIAHHHTDPAERDKAKKLVDLLTPVAKGFFTDKAVEASRHGLQLYGGNGYMKEYPMEKLVRDLEVTPIYEGANPAQATAILRSLKNVSLLTDQIREFVFSQARAENSDMLPLIKSLSAGVNMVDEQAQWLLQNKSEHDAAATQFMHLLGTVTSSYMLAQSAAIAYEKLKSGISGEEQRFYEGKIDTAKFQILRELQAYTSPEDALKAGKDSLQMRDVVIEKAVFKQKPGATGQDVSDAGPDKQLGIQ